MKYIQAHTEEKLLGVTISNTLC